MKRIISLMFVCIISVIFVGCETSTITSDNVSANQETFLNDMAKGIKARLAYANDEKERTDEELAEYYRNLVDLELDEISKYADMGFSDSTFNSLAHYYIQACKMQHTATYNYRNEELYNALWNGGATVRSGIIVTLYEQYNLGLTSEEAEQYKNNKNSYSVSGDTSEIEFLDHFNDDDDVVLKQGDLTIESATGKVENSSSSDKSYFDYCFVVKNNSKYELNMIYVECAILDKDENVLGTTSAYAWVTVPSNKTVNCESSINLSDYPNAKYLLVDSIGYDGDGDHTSHIVALPETTINDNIINIE